MKSQREVQLSGGGSVTLSPATAPRRNTTSSEKDVSRETRKKIELTTAPAPPHLRRSTYTSDVKACQSKYDRWPKHNKKGHKKGRAKDQPPRTPHYPREHVPKSVGTKIDGIRRQPAQDAAAHDRRPILSLEEKLQRQKQLRVERKVAKQTRRGRDDTNSQVSGGSGSLSVPPNPEDHSGHANELPSGGTPPLIPRREGGRNDDDRSDDGDDTPVEEELATTLSTTTAFGVATFTVTQMNQVEGSQYSVFKGYVLVPAEERLDFAAKPIHVMVYPRARMPSPTVAATMIQRAARRRSDIKLSRQRRQHVAATIVQHAVKQAGRRRRATKSKAATTIQSRVRGLLARTLVCRDRSLWRTATLRIQRIFRGHRGRRIFKSMALTRAMAAIQVAEGVLARIEAVELETWGPHAVATVKDRVTWIATALSVARLRAEHLRWVAAIVIQRAARRRLANRLVTMLRRHKASVAIQCRTRGSRARAFVCRVRSTQRQLAAVITIQCAERCRLANKSAARLRRRKAAVAIQRAARSFVCRVHLTQHRHAAAAIIQGYARGLAARALAHSLREKRRMMAFLAARPWQYVPPLDRQMRRVAAIHFQRIFRGSQGRRLARYARMTPMERGHVKFIEHCRRMKERKRLQDEKLQRMNAPSSDRTRSMAGGGASPEDDWVIVRRRDLPPPLPRFEGVVDFTRLKLVHAEFLTLDDWYSIPVDYWESRSAIHRAICEAWERLMYRYFWRQMDADPILTLCDSDLRAMRRHVDCDYYPLTNQERRLARARGIAFIWHGPKQRKKLYLYEGRA